MQVDLRILPLKRNFFQTSTVFYMTFSLKYRIVLQDQSEDYIVEEIGTRGGKTV